ncbi:MAG TPA: hypothetical protein DCE00_00260 [Firmicutes bacterium]|jgi:hypothetical protein|nr:hypothetical protein [Bacillota bacterium]
MSILSPISVITIYPHPLSAAVFLTSYLPVIILKKFKIFSYCFGIIEIVTRARPDKRGGLFFAKDKEKSAAG